MAELIELEFVNRTEVLERLHDMRAGRRTARVLLIRAVDGMGKSWLLRRALAEQGDAPAALVLLGAPDTQDSIAFIRQVREKMPRVQWGAVDKVLGQIGKAYTITIRREGPMPARAPIAFGDNAQVGDVIGGDAIQVNLPGGEDPLVRDALAAELSAAFVDVMRAFRAEAPALLLLDNYQQRTLDIEGWMLHTFLPNIRDGALPGVLVVIAGQEIPEFERDWRLTVDAAELQGLPESAIHEYWVTRRRLPEADVPRVIQWSRGNPQLLAQIADNASLP